MNTRLLPITGIPVGQIPPAVIVCGDPDRAVQVSNHLDHATLISQHREYACYGGKFEGMPVAVCAGLALPQWREPSKIEKPLPADRIILVDVRNLDPAEKELIDELGVTVAAPAAGFPGVDLKAAVDELAGRCDLIYLHIDSDILDQIYVPNHGTREPNGPHMPQVLEAIDTVMATGKVAAFAVVSVYGEGKGREISVTSGTELIRGGLKSWSKHGGPSLPSN